MIANRPASTGSRYLVSSLSISEDPAHEFGEFLQPIEGDHLTADLEASAKRGAIVGHQHSSGGGNLDAFFMGAYTVLSRVPKLRMLRFAGASAGGMLPFEIALKGERRTLESHVAYGVLQEAWPITFGNALSAAAVEDALWRVMAAWQAEKWNATLSCAATHDFPICG